MQGEGLANRILAVHNQERAVVGFRLPGVIIVFIKIITILGLVNFSNNENLNTVVNLIYGISEKECTI